MGFHGEALIAPRPTPKLEDHPSSNLRDCKVVILWHYKGQLMLNVHLFHLLC